MGSTFGHSSASEKKARLEAWRGKDPIKVSGGKCTTTAKGVGSADISEAGRKLLADGLQRLLAAEQSNGLITRVFRASRNSERDAPPRRGPLSSSEKQTQSSMPAAASNTSLK